MLLQGDAVACFLVDGLRQEGTIEPFPACKAIMLQKNDVGAMQVQDDFQHAGLHALDEVRQALWHPFGRLMVFQPR